jgi:uncharacterized protein YegP (UPF0339 family)
MTHHFEVKNTASAQFMARFNYNSEAIIWSEEYKAKSTALDSVEIVKEHACTAVIVDQTIGEKSTDYRFEIFDTADDQFMVRFVASNGKTVMVSERYTAKHNAIKAAKSVQANAAGAPVEDNTSSASKAA